MNDLRKAAEMALETLERLDKWLALRYGNELTPPEREVVKALRQALAMETAERVDETAKGKHEPVCFLRETAWSYEIASWDDLNSFPVYTAPPHHASDVKKREWVGLTEYQKLRFAEKFRIDTFAVEEIEAKLKEKNK
jgi:hypothetical protein